MSWAAIASTKARPSGAGVAALAASSGGGGSAALRLLVVDANAIIDGLRLEGIADKAVTIQEVLDEIRDKQSRAFLRSLPYELTVAEPSDESMAAVTKFARATGDVSALSSTDIKLMALAHSLEVAAHGAGHLAAHPNQPRMHNRAAFASQSLPGWGSVPNPADWAEVDAANEADEAALEAASTSRIARRVQQLNLDPDQQDNAFLQEDSLPASAAPLTPGAVAAAAGGSVAAAAAASPAGGSSSAGGQPAQAAEAAPAAAADDGSAAAAEDDGWETAAVSKAAARHRRRKAVKMQAHQQAFERDWEDHTQLVQEEQQQEQPQADSVQPQLSTPQKPAARAADACDAGDAAAADADADTAAGGGDSDGEHSGDPAEEATNEELLAAAHTVYTAVDEGGDGAAGHQQQPAAADAAAAPAATAGPAPGSRGWQSSVAIITGDFAMQNVLLQMGLRLLTKDGRRVSRLSRYALRCSACFTVCREPGRLFCPKCGNLSLDRVEVVVGADGAEYYGVAKRHVLRGTRFSLPKPKGGRAADPLVLREDVFLMKVRALGRRAVKKKAAGDEDGGAPDAAAAGGGGVDPFAPEYSTDTWHVPSQQELAVHKGLAAVLQPAWKHNPNERKLTRSNRRG